MQKGKVREDNFIISKGSAVNEIGLESAGHLSGMQYSITYTATAKGLILKKHQREIAAIELVASLIYERQWIIMATVVIDRYYQLFVTVCVHS